MHMPLPSSNVKAARLAFFMALIAWTMFAGKDVSWDVGPAFERAATATR